MSRKTKTTVPETACLRPSPAATCRTNQCQLPREADVGWERAAYLALYRKAP